MPKLIMKISVVLVLFATCIAAFADGSSPEKARAEAIAAEAEMKAANARHAEIRDAIENLEQKIRKETELVDVTPQAVRRLIATLQEQREQLELDRAGAEGRRAGLEDAIAKLSKRLTDRVATDDVAVELQKVVDVRQTASQQMKQLYASGAASAADLSAAEANLATARAELAKERQKSVSSASSEALDSWNRQLLELSVTSLEQSARLQYLQKRLAELAAAIADVNRVEQLQIELDVPQRSAQGSTPRP
ncbi:MAG TPA: hypothetical protein VFE47_16370 [Tepidisphaeraceae bacterium]|nr:hypothetical protein [Tepidisphaeraceae bacterium]